uniref:Complement C3-like n=1 Tax=Lepidonotus squamatus TaxID=222003 RepID=A0A2P1L4D6_LEPSQ|nr:complement C3-like [Lepidonotus squamatus]
MEGPGLLMVLVLLAISSHVTATRLFVVAPNMFNIGEMETVSVLVTGLNKKTPVTLTVRTPGTNAVHYNAVSAQLDPNKQKILQVRVNGALLGEVDDNGRQYVKLRAQCPDINFDKETHILVSRRTGTVFLQTDKPIYSPGQSVIIRVFALDEQRLGTDMPIRVQLKNPQGIITTREVGNTQKGYFMLKHTLSDRPLQGNWTVLADYGENFSQSREVKIEVKKYVLPHFHVRVLDLPEYIDSNTQQLSGRVVARYSFAAPVVGMAKVMMRVVRDGEATYLTVKRTALMFGEGQFSLSRQELEGDGAIPTLIGEGARLQVEATVTETSTGIRESVVTPGCPFTDSPYRVTFDGTSASFMPGLPFGVYMRVQHINGLPAAEKTLHVTAVDSRGRPLQVDQDNNENLDPVTDKGGRHLHYFTVSNAASPITIKVKVQGDAGESRLVVPVTSMAEYMLVRPRDKAILTPGRPAYFEADLTERKNMEQLQYMLVSGGRILDVAEERNKDSHYITFSRHVDFSMTPSVRLVAWYFTKRGQLVSASTTLPVETKCKTEAHVGRMDRKDGLTNPIKPLDQFRLAFRGPIGAKVAVMAVDKSIYFLNNRSQLTRKTFFDEFMTRDLGCAAGGGMNATDVFHLAGLAVLSNSDRTPHREQEKCRSEVRSRRKRSANNEGEGPADSVCCDAGNGFAANLTNIPHNLHEMRTTCYRASNQTRLNYRECRNTFVRCCVKRLVARYESSQEHGRSDNDLGDSESDEFLEDEKQVTPREDFPESWMIFSDLTLPRSGQLTKEYTLPGTVTTWVIQAVTMSDTEGMCVATPFEQVVKKDLFVRLHLPHTAVQGEQIELAATVYKLTPGDTRIKVGLLGREGSCSDAPVNALSSQILRVQGSNSVTARWPYVPMETGELPVTVKLFSQFSSPDIVTKTLKVVPSGDLVVAPILQITQDPSGRLSTVRQWAGRAGAHSYTALKDTTTKVQINTLKLRLPAEALADTAIVKFSLIGDVMTPVVEGLAHGVEAHLHKAGGCGEQTMARVGPTVFAAEYLRRANLLTPALEADAVNKIKQGVNHMLRYRKPDGSFSVWTTHPSNVWLTAFALKTFVQARTFTDQVDEGMLRSGFAWLMTQNTAVGLFDKVGLVHHRNMAGGTKGQLSTTAYVYIAMMEAGIYQQHTAELDPAMNHLAVSAQTENDPYTLAIVSYALAKRNHTQAAAINRRLLSKARVLPGTQPPQMYWPTTGLPQPLGSELEVETAGYAVLAQLAVGHVTGSNAIVEWLIRQRYGGPVFKSTQSTVVSLQALSLYSSMARRDDLRMKCRLTSIQDNRLIKQMELTHANRLVQQTVEVTDQLGEDLTLRCEGEGILHAAIETSYYSTKTNDDLCAFNITAAASSKNIAGTSSFGIRVCTRLRDASNQLAMPMIDVGIGSGFIPVNRTLQLVLNTPEVDFFEVNDRSVVFYLNKIPSTKDLCLDFDVKEEVKVENVRPVPVKVYAYYEPDKLHCRKFYDPTGGDDSMLHVSCDKERGYCKCLENACPPCYGYDAASAKPLKTKKLLINAACGPDSTFDYVFKARLVRMEDVGGELKLTMMITSVAKEGTEHRDDLEGEERTFFAPTKCKSCRYEEGKNYIIMGEDAKSVKDGDPEYHISPQSYLLRLYTRSEGRTWEMRSINRAHKQFLDHIKEKNCST